MPLDANQASARHKALSALLLVLAFAIGFCTVSLLFNRARDSEGGIKNACYIFGILDIFAIFLQLQWGLRTVFARARGANHGDVEW